eukprot:11228348-Lingulodinium_polyedra.AAC.1
MDTLMPNAATELMWPQDNHQEDEPFSLMTKPWPAMQHLAAWSARAQSSVLWWRNQFVSTHCCGRLMALYVAQGASVRCSSTEHGAGKEGC